MADSGVMPPPRPAPRRGITSANGGNPPPNTPRRPPKPRTLAHPTETPVAQAGYTETPDKVLPPPRPPSFLHQELVFTPRDGCFEPSPPSHLPALPRHTPKRDRNDLLEYAISKGFSEPEFRSALESLNSNFSRDQLFAQLVAEQAKSSPALPARSRSTRCVSTAPRYEFQVKTDRIPETERQHAIALGIPVYTANLRSIVIDGSNVAMIHGRSRAFSCRGILIVVKWFQDRGHTDVKVYVPSYNLRENTTKDIRDKDILHSLKQRGVLIETPSRDPENGRNHTHYDDRFILSHAISNNSVVVSNDTYRDLVRKDPDKYRPVTSEQLLTFVFNEDQFMPSEDPLGRYGPNLENFLRKKPPTEQECKYGLSCTFGDKCKFKHPERETAHWTDTGQNRRYNKSDLLNVESSEGRSSSMPYIPSQAAADRVFLDEPIYIASRGPASLGSQSTTPRPQTNTTREHNHASSISRHASVNGHPDIPNLTSGREKVFRSLAPLFTAEKVAAVMTRLPMEENAKVITALVINE